MITNTISNEIRRRRVACGYSQRQLAERAQCAVKHIERLENHRNPINPTIRGLEAIARGLGCNVTDLFCMSSEDIAHGAIAIRPLRAPQRKLIALLYKLTGHQVTVLVRVAECMLGAPEPSAKRKNRPK